MRELTHLRSAHGRALLQDDGSVRYEFGGGIAHHRVGREWIVTDCTLDESGGECSPRSHPRTIRIPVNFASPWRVGSVSLRPLDYTRPPAKVERVGASMKYVDAWDGVTVTRRVTPEGVTEELSVTSPAGQRVLSWAVTGSLGGMVSPTWAAGDDTGPVPWTFADGVLSFDLTGVPVGAVVS